MNPYNIVQLIERAVKMEVEPAQPDPDETAPEGYLYIVQVGAYNVYMVSAVSLSCCRPFILLTIYFKL